MAPSIQVLKLGIDNVWVIRDRRVLLVDGGEPGKAGLIEPGLARLGVQPREVGLLVLTHGHWDHMGCAAALKSATGAPLAMHGAERDRLEEGRVVMPPGITPWGRIFGGFLGRFMVPSVRIPPTPVDVVLSEADLSLEPWGIAGRVLHTPGHSPGSVTVLLDSGDAFVGDLAMNWFMLGIGPRLPLFAEDEPGIRGSVERLLAAGATTIHPAHGAPFPAAVLARLIGVPRR